MGPVRQEECKQRPWGRRLCLKNKSVGPGDCSAVRGFGAGVIETKAPNRLGNELSEGTNRQTQQKTLLGRGPWEEQ